MLCLIKTPHSRGRQTDGAASWGVLQMGALQILVENVGALEEYASTPVFSQTSGTTAEV